jgi:hypothetical protein
MNRPVLYRDYRNALYIKSCVDFCLYMAERSQTLLAANENLAAAEKEKWDMKRRLFECDMAMGLLTATRDHEIESHIEADPAWERFVKRGPVQKQRWELESDY